MTIFSQPRGLGEYAQSALLKTETGAVQCGARGLEVMMVMPMVVLVSYIRKCQHGSYQFYDLDRKILSMTIFKSPGARLRLHGKPRRRSWGTSTTTLEERCSSKLTKLALIVILILIVSIVIIIITVKLSKQCTLKRCNRQSRVTFISANLSNDLTAYCWPNAVITYPVTSIKESHKKENGNSFSVEKV